MKKQYLYYSFLVALFVIATTYQARYSYGQIKYLLGQSQGMQLPVATERFSPTIIFVTAEAEQSGAHKGDRLLAVGGQPYTGRHLLLDAYYGSKPGDPIAVRIRHKESEQLPAEQELTLHFAPFTHRDPGIGGWIFTLVLNIATPFFCLLLGFVVTALRPRDPVAWLLLALMLSFGMITPGFDPSLWKGALRDVMVAYQTFFQSSWPIWMLLFGIYFPERWDVDRRFPWAKWVIIVPNALFTVKSVITNLGGYHNSAGAGQLWRAMVNIEIAEIIISMTTVGLFFMAIGWKSGTATAPDSRRRLRLVQIGTTIGLTPAFILFIISVVRGVQPSQSAPFWIQLPALLLLFLFPLTFAYVIVVHRALDVRVVIRQGVRYAFARGGVMTLRFLLIAAIALAMFFQINRPDASVVETVVISALGLALIFMMRRLGEWLVGWTDRRFFREAYNAEQILSELGEKVRTMVETGPLLETVAQRISESLHVPRVTLLLSNDGVYRPAYALGFSETPVVSFSEKAVTAEHLRREREPLRVYFDDEQSWVNTADGIDGERSMLQTLDSQLLLPLAVKEKLPGFISLGPKQSEEPYSATDLRLLQSVATQTGLALENSQLTARIASEVAQRERLNRELEIAREVQERLFPQNLPRVKGLDYCGACRPALGVGGDYYDFLLLPGDRLGIAIGDVSGKGIAAALLMASLQASLRGQAISGTADLAELMGNVNRLVYDASASNRYATFFYAVYEPATRRLTFVNAGHNPPVVLRKVAGEWQITRLEEGGAVVGLLRNYPYSQAETTVQPGDVLVAFTDGISEAMNPAEEEWGEEQLIEAIKSCDGLSASDTLSLLVEEADKFAAGAKQHDDMTLLVMRVV
jgi:phosphoserine phosphatase RsbU/P